MQECVSICAMVAAYDSGTTRANEMLTVLDAILPLFLKQIVQDKKTEVICCFIKVDWQPIGCWVNRLADILLKAKEMRDLIQQLSNTMKTILHNR